MLVMVHVSFTWTNHYHLMERSLNVVKVWVSRLGMLCHRHLGLLLLEGNSGKDVCLLYLFLISY